jgi:hypothetical protein
VSTTLDDLTRPHRSALYLLMRRLVELDKPLLVRSEIVETFEDVAAAAEGVDLGSSDLAALLRSAQEGVVRAPFLYLAVRTRIARWRYLQLTLDDASEYLRVKDGSSKETDRCLEYLSAHEGSVAASTSSLSSRRGERQMLNGAVTSPGAGGAARARSPGSPRPSEIARASFRGRRMKSSRPLRRSPACSGACR